MYRNTLAIGKTCSFSQFNDDDGAEPAEAYQNCADDKEGSEADGSALPGP